LVRAAGSVFALVNTELVNTELVNTSGAANINGVAVSKKTLATA
jgi:hypothetical protein